MGLGWGAVTGSGGFGLVGTPEGPIWLFSCLQKKEKLPKSIPSVW